MQDPEINCVRCGNAIPYPIVHPSPHLTVVHINCGTCGGGVSLEVHIVGEGEAVSVHTVIPDVEELLNVYKTNMGMQFGPATASRFIDTVKLVRSWALAKREALEGKKQ